MESFLDQETCEKMLNVSRETSVKFEIYLKTLKKWQNNLNLVGSSTLDDPWRRHILDCGQIGSGPDLGKLHSDLCCGCVIFVF